MSKYKCYFEIAVNKYRRLTMVDELCKVKDGFWVNSELEYTQASDCKFWIPASRILYIEKVKA